MATRWAILIGVNGYHESLGALRFCTNDARLLWDTLQSESCGFEPQNMLLLTDDSAKECRPTFGNIHSCLANWLSRPGGDDFVMVFFAGHGQEYRGRSVLVPIDATRGTATVTGIPLDFVQDLMRRCPARQRLLVVDACHSGAGRDVATMSTVFRDTLDAGAGMYTIASCDRSQISYEWDERGHGVFTYYLAEALCSAPPDLADMRVSAEAIYNYTYARVRQWTATRRLTQDPVRVSRVAGTIPLAVRRPGHSKASEPTEHSTGRSDSACTHSVVWARSLLNAYSDHLVRRLRTVKAADNRLLLLAAPLAVLGANGLWSIVSCTFLGWEGLGPHARRMLVAAPVIGVLLAMWWATWRARARLADRQSELAGGYQGDARTGLYAVPGMLVALAIVLWLNLGPVGRVRSATDNGAIERLKGELDRATRRNLELEAEGPRRVPIPTEELSEVARLEKTAESGSAQAMASLGIAYAEGKLGLQVDLQKAADWLDRAAKGPSADSGCSEAALYLARMIEKGVLPGRTVADAIPLYGKAWMDGGEVRLLELAKAGSQEAMYELGLRHREIARFGGFRHKHRDEAAQWFERAAMAGTLDAWIALGEMYEHTYFKRDIPKALSFYLRAAERGHVEAMYIVAHIRETGDGQAIYQLADEERQLTRDPSQARTWYLRAAEAGETESSIASMYQLAQLFELGKGGAKDIEEAKKWYSKAQALGHAEAREALRRLGQ